MRNIIWTVVICLISTLSLAQVPHLSKYFDLGSRITLTNYTEEETSKELVGYGDEQCVYFCKKRAFQNKENGFEALVYVVDYKRGSQSILKLPFPENKKSLANARKYWIYGLSVYKDTILLATQTANLLYKNENGDWKLANTFAIPNSDFSWLYHQHVYAISEDNNHGFDLWHAPLDANSMEKVCEFNIRAHFLLQYGPNGFIKPDRNGNLYFINTPDMILYKYDFEGNLLAACPVELPGWLPMPSDYIAKLNAMPYGSDRAMYAYFNSTKYSFPLEILPINENTFLQSYHHYDTVLQKESLKMLFLRINPEWKHAEYVECTSTFVTDKIIEKDEFPIYAHQPELCLSVCIPNGIAQISKETSVDWCGMTGKEYTQAKEQFLSTQKPIMKLTIVKLKEEF